MHSSRRLETNDARTDDSIFHHQHIALLNEKHWSYLQKRYHMSPRELQVGKLVCRGFKNDEIVKALKIKPGTLKTHLRNIYRKLRVKSKIALLLKCVDRASDFSEKSGVAPLIVDIKKPVKKRSTLTGVSKKHKKKDKSISK